MDTTENLEGVEQFVGHEIMRSDHKFMGVGAMYLTTQTLVELI